MQERQTSAVAAAEADSVARAVAIHAEQALINDWLGLAPPQMQ